MTDAASTEQKSTQIETQKEAREPDNERTEAEFWFCLEAAGRADPEDETSTTKAGAGSVRGRRRRRKRTSPGDSRDVQ